MDADTWPPICGRVERYVHIVEDGGAVSVAGAEKHLARCPESEGALGRLDQPLNCGLRQFNPHRSAVPGSDPQTRAANPDKALTVVHPQACGSRALPSPGWTLDADSGIDGALRR